MANKNPIIYIFLNKDLHMSVGKASAQAGHAVAMSVIDKTSEASRDEWIKNPHRTIIVLEARDERHMRNIKEYCAERGFFMKEIIDEGVNEIDPHTWTALASTILDKDDEKTQLTFSTFDLYRDLIRVRLDYER